MQFYRQTVFTHLSNVSGALNPNFLAIGSIAVDNNDYLIYNPTSGALSYDADANGHNAAVQIALIGTNLTVTNADFVVI